MPWEKLMTEEEKKTVEAEKFKKEISKCSEEELDKVAGGVYCPHFYKPKRATSEQTKKAGPWW